MLSTVCKPPSGVTRPSFAWAAITLLAFALPAGAAFSQDTDTNTNAKPKPEPSFEFVDGAAVTLSPDASTEFKFDILIRNAGNKDGVPSLELVSDAANRCGAPNLAIEPKDLVKIDPKGVSMTHATISGVKLPTTCYVRLTAGNPAGNTSLKQIKLSQQYLTTDLSYPLYVCLVMAALVGVVTGCVACAKIDKMGMNTELGSPAWELDKSWISNTTVVSSVIATAMALSALPELTKYASKGGYAALALLTTLAVVVAPFLFTAFRVGEVKEDGSVDYGTCVWLFLLSGSITLFAGMAQVVVLFLLFDEIFLSYDFWSMGPDHQPWLSLNVGLVSTAVLAVALCRYVGYSMFQTISSQVKVAGTSGTKALVAKDSVPSPRPSWPVL
jgi:hypothetical protein